MKKEILALLLIFFLFFKGFSQQFTEILGRPTNNSITVNMLFSQTVQVYFEYGSVKGNYTGLTQTTTTTLDEPLEIKIQGLNPDTRYYYRTRYRIPGEIIYKAGNEHTFVTQRKPGTTFRFTVEADPHPYDKKCYPPLWNIALQNQAKDSADFMIDMGDTFGDDHNPFTITSKEVKQLHLDNRSYFGTLCHSLPLFFCLGNHEGESGYYLLQTPPNNLAIWETIWRKRYWPNPYPDGFYTGNTTSEPYGIDLPGNYYSWIWGDALYVVLDAYRYYTANAKPRGWDWTIGMMQYSWFKETLEKSKAKFKFVFAHHLLGESRGAALIAKQFEWGGYDSKGNSWEFTANRPGWEMPLHQLMVKNKVNIFFQGHDHLFVREELDGLIYQTVPMPSDSSYTLGMIANGDAFEGSKLTGSGHLRITVTPEKAQVDYILAVLPKDETEMMKNGKVAYSYSFTPTGTNTSSTIFSDWLKNPAIHIWPNPFRDSVEIQFELQKSGKAEIVIYDMSGKLVDRIDAGYAQPGINKVKWDAIKRNGKSIRKGVYNCVVITSEGKYSRILILN